MTEMTCTYRNRDEALISYLYEDGSDGGRAAFDAHLAGCAVCRTELAALTGVRRQLADWSVASPRSSVSSPSPSPQPPVPSPSWWQDVPMWARAAAAVLCIGASAGLANVQVRHDDRGWMIGTGWLTAVDSRPSSVVRPVVSQETAPTRAELAALETQLSELRAAQTTLAAQATAAAQRTEPAAQTDVLRRVRALVDESERRQERELALRVGQVLRDVSAQRQADLRRIDDKVGVIQTNTGAEVMRQRQLLQNYANYLSRVSLQK